MTSTLPNVPLCPRAGRSGRIAAAALSSIGGGPASPAASAVDGSSWCANPSGRFSAIAVLRADAARLLGERPQSLHSGEDPPLSVIETLFDVDGEDVAPARRADPERDRNGVLGLVADRDRDAVHSQLLGSSCGPAMQPNRRLAGRQPLYRELGPADAPNAEPEDLAHGLLRGPPSGEVLR